MDHMNLLGDSMEKIAIEKAGIIKKEIPVVIGEHHPLTHTLFETIAAAHQAPIYFADKIRFCSDWKFDQHLLKVEITDPRHDEKTVYDLDLSGIYQTKNLVTTLQAIDLLQVQGWNISRRDLLKGLSQVRKTTGLHGRWEQIHHRPDIVLDVGHNEDGILQVVRQIELTDHEELHVVIGLVKDKEIDKILSLLPKHANFYFTRAQIPRALPEDKLESMAIVAGLKGKHYSTVQTALQAAVSRANPHDLIIVCGSVFIVGEVNLNDIKL
jgi:dihydrofolate synthase/folylpolyglutamate synthase